MPAVRQRLGWLTGKTEAAKTIEQTTEAATQIATEQTAIGADF
ncbi:MAG: hypothetical protein ACUVX8_07945 [Candidatus Zipacnadales bacterium]